MLVKRICNILSTVIVVCMLLIAAVLLVPHALGYQPLTVVSGSMEPTFHVGSVIFVKETDPATIEVGDVITFDSEGLGKPTTHRVIEVDRERETFVTQGDNNDVADGAVTYSQVIGRASGLSIPLIGYVSEYIRTTPGKLAAGAVILVVILLVFLPDLFVKKVEKAVGHSGKKEE